MRSLIMVTTLCIAASALATNQYPAKGHLRHGNIPSYQGMSLDAAPVTVSARGPGPDYRVDKLKQDIEARHSRESGWVIYNHTPSLTWSKKLLRKVSPVAFDAWQSKVIANDPAAQKELKALNSKYSRLRDTVELQAGRETSVE